MPNSQAEDFPGYWGVPKDYKPESGSTSPTALPTPFELQRGYGSLGSLSQKLNQLIQESSALIDQAEAKLNVLSLRVDSDSKLAEAQKAEWPSALGEPKDYISYAQYKALNVNGNRGAAYIQKAYEEQMRGPAGSNAIDVVTNAKAMKQEAKNIQGFLTNYIKDVNDTSEYRTLELFEDWADDGIKYTRIYKGMLEARESQQDIIPKAELDQITHQDAIEYQALFKIKVNTVNNEIAQIQEDVVKEAHLMSPLFYDKYLGPTLKLRLNVGVGLESKVSQDGFLAQQARAASPVLNTQMQNVLADQLKRNQNFVLKQDNLQQRIKVRDTYSGMIQELAAVGNPVSEVFKEVAISEEEGAHFSEAELAGTDAVVENEFKSAHAMLTDLESDDHPMYFQKSGGTITGDIELVDLVKIDGMDPSKHRHRGINVDGTERIHGEDIVGLVTDSISAEELVEPPKNLRLISTQLMTGTGKSAFIDALVAWESNPKYTFDLQYVAINKIGTLEAPPDFELTTTYTPAVTVVAGIGTDTNFFTYASATALYSYNFVTSTNYLLAGSEGVRGDIVGEGTSARFDGIRDIVQDFSDGSIYVVDGSRKVKATDRPTVNGFLGSTTITTVYQSQYDIRRIDTQGQHSRNTAYVIEGPLPNGTDRVMKLTDLDNNETAPGVYYATIIPMLSTFSNLIDIAASSNGNVFVLTATQIIMYDPAIDTLIRSSIAEENGTPKSITCDHNGQVYIAYA